MKNQLRAWGFAVVASLVVAGWSHVVVAADFQEAKEFHVLKQPERITSDASKIEVVELFWYGCSHCYDLESKVDEWTKKLPADVTFIRVPAMFSPRWEIAAKAYYTFEALGVTAKVHRAFFDAIHVSKRQFNDVDAIVDFLKDFGQDKAAVLDAFNSFGVDANVRKAKQMLQHYAAEGVPSLIVNGKYRTSVADAGGPDQTFQVVDFLIAKERSAKPAN